MDVIGVLVPVKASLAYEVIVTSHPDLFVPDANLFYAQ